MQKLPIRAIRKRLVMRYELKASANMEESTVAIKWVQKAGIWKQI